METSFTRLARIEHPIVLAPMAGGPSTPELVAAVSNAGGLGSHGAQYLSPDALRSDIQKIKSLTNKPFAVNIFIPSQVTPPTDKESQEMLDFTNEIRRKLGINPLPELPPTKNNFNEHIEIILQEKPSAFSFVFGMLDPQLIAEFKKRNILVMGTGSSLTEAEELQAAGVDAICLQGFEGGGHRGVFATHTDSEMNIRPLLEITKDKIKVPVIAAGGIMTGRNIWEMLSMGASAVQMGTAFLLCKEAGTSKCYRDALSSKNPKHTEITTAFSGRRARGLLNQYMKEFKAKSKQPLPFPIQNTLTGDIRRKATEMNISDYVSLWAGTEVDKIRKIDAATLMETLIREMSA